MNIQHNTLVGGGWSALSLSEQLGNVGSEVSRTEKWKGRDEKIFWEAADRALELFDLTIDDPRWRGRLKELVRGRELFCDAVSGGKEYGTALPDLNRYFLYFALAARSQR